MTTKNLAAFDRGDVGSRGSRYTDTKEYHLHNRMGQEKIYGRTEATITGYACACPTPDAPTRPSLIVDPFGGTGTTALCASVLGRIGVSVDLSHDYSRLASWRTTDPAQRAKAMRVEKPPVELDGQADLFGGEAA